MLDEGTDEFEADIKGGAPRPKGAYYKNIERKMLLKTAPFDARCARPAPDRAPSHNL